MNPFTVLPARARLYLYALATAVGIVFACIEVFTSPDWLDGGFSAGDLLMVSVPPRGFDEGAAARGLEEALSANVKVLDEGEAPPTEGD